MSSRWFDCLVDGEKVGAAVYSNTVDLWRDGLRTEENELVGEWTCTQPMEEPPRVQLVDPHQWVWAEVASRVYEGETYPYLYCPECKCLVPPPTDEDAYYLDYPEEWLEKVEETMLKGDNDETK